MSKKGTVEKLLTVLSRDWSQHSDLVIGDLLTIIDSAVTDSTQRKATKDLIKKAFYYRDQQHWENIRYTLKYLALALDEKVDCLYNVNVSENNPLTD